jgi:hypothetical protein
LGSDYSGIELRSLLAMVVRISPTLSCQMNR